MLEIDGESQKWRPGTVAGPEGLFHKKPSLMFNVAYGSLRKMGTVNVCAQDIQNQQGSQATIQLVTALEAYLDGSQQSGKTQPFWLTDCDGRLVADFADFGLRLQDTEVRCFSTAPSSAIWILGFCHQTVARQYMISSGCQH